MPLSVREQQEAITSVRDPFARNSLRLAYHIRKYMLLYVIGVLGAIALALFPTVGGGSGSNVAAAGSATGGAYGGGGGSAGAGTAGGTAAAGSTGDLSASAANPSAGAAGGSAAAGGAAAAGGGAGGASAGASGGSNSVQVGTGTTRGGFQCGQGVRQLSFSQYADPCVNKFTGNNGGATYNGVTASTITVSVRHTSDSTGANAAATQAEAEAAGGDSNSALEGYRQNLVNYFNQTFELYGRQVKLVDYNGQGNGTNESLGQGQAAACADADQAANTIHAFADINFGGNFESQPFSDCAAKYHLYVPEGSAYFPESSYQADAPYVWGITMNCSLIAQEVGEFIGKQMLHTPAKWAGMDGAFNLANGQRKFGTYVPNNAGYQQCVGQTTNIVEGQYGGSKSQMDQYNYALDISTFPQDAQKAIVQFAANHDTTVILACDPISPIFLTQDAVQQNYAPEWLLIGVALTDSDNWAQLWDQKAVAGHLFGLSQAGSTQSALDPNGEACKALAAAKDPCDPSTSVMYYEIISMFNQLQAAGPTLNPANIAAGTQSLPPGGGATGASGTWHFGNTHTAIIDSREIFWVSGQTSPANNKQGTYTAIYGGKRFQVGQFPTGQPPFYS